MKYCTSLWFDKPTIMIGSIGRVTSKPFKNSHDEQIELVSSLVVVNSRRNLYPADNRTADVAEDVAYSGEDSTLG